MGQKNDLDRVWRAEGDGCVHWIGIQRRDSEPWTVSWGLTLGQSSSVLSRSQLLRSLSGCGRPAPAARPPPPTVTTLPRPCLDCGQPVVGASRCLSCTPAKARTAARGYDARWQRLAGQAIRQHPWCTGCGTSGIKTNPLTGDHLRWPALSLADVDVVCRRCNSRRGARRVFSRRNP
jgi:5-methylcytosine-specific restriction endonuclease McrA